MSKLTSKLNVQSKKMGNTNVLPILFSFMMMVIFILTTSFTSVSNENDNSPNSSSTEYFSSDESNPCTLSVEAGDDVELCDTGEVILTATVSGQSECTDCTNEYNIENTSWCGKNLHYALWLKDDGNNKTRTFSNVNLKWKEFADGTATLKGTVVDNNDSQIILDIDVTYSGRTTAVPQGSPKDHFCHTESADGWVYYTDVTGTITQTDGSWSFDISRRGPSFQLGNGANVTETEVGKYGGSGWFDTTDGNFNQGDFNINIGDCITSQTNEATYEWSTGETTPTITVTEGGTYTVTVKDCNDCVVSDSVEVTFTNSPTVDLGDDQAICVGDSTTLTAGEGDSFTWSTGETTSSITVSPTTATEYSVIVKKGSCEVSDDVIVTVNDVTANAGEDVTIEEGQSTILTASGGDTYEWSIGETTESITVTPEVTTEYTVSAFKNGCEDIDTVTVTVEAGCVVASVGEDVTICKGQSTVISANGGDSYVWTTEDGEIATVRFIRVAPTVTTEYTVTVTKNGCPDPDTATIVVTVDQTCTDGGPNRIASVYPTIINFGTKMNLDLKIDKKQDIRISLHNLTGGNMGPMITKTVDVNNETISVDFSMLQQLSAGIYIVKIVGDGWTKMEKIIISNKSN